MEDLYSKFLFDPLVSRYNGPTIYNDAGGGDGGGDGGTPVDDPDAPDPNTPAGKRWATMRRETAEAKKQAEESELARVKAEAAAEATQKATDDFMAKYKPEVPKPEEENEEELAAERDPDDTRFVKQVVADTLKEAGLDGKQIAEALEKVATNQQASNVESQIKDAVKNLEEEYKDTVPFRRDDVIKYAQEKGYGLAMPDADIEQVLKLAHEQMNMDELIKMRSGTQSETQEDDPRKTAPQMESSADNTAIPLDPENPITKMESVNQAEVLDEGRNQAREIYGGQM